ncbi:MAG: glycerol dehydratase reactivase beta/small subunit family protein [Ardenticatenaceae bacterium]|nr:glycerol dehydratase reactivase beta/small subunit family protein [Ardenticatenaceae bacterium]MCB8987163.1 glycerol dehydratase reactivase beta/small subunit family protein [Ardenticatenaceae bacterium]
MDAREQDRPAIHVALLPGTDPSLYRWVQIGAEEEGVPCRLVSEAAHDLVTMAYEAARSSRFNIGVAVSPEAVVLHERHMPVEKPVMSLKFTGQADYFCRVMGANAARMVIRKPFRFAGEQPATAARSKPPAPNGLQSALPQAFAARPRPAFAGAPMDDPTQVAELVALIVQKLNERGIR